MSSVMLFPTQTLPVNELVPESPAQHKSGMSLHVAWRWCLIVLTALLMNALIVWMLYSLNAMQMRGTVKQHQVMTVFLNQRDPHQLPEKQEESHPLEKPEVLTVQLALPDPTPPTPQWVALDLNLAMPNISPVTVSVMTLPSPAPQAVTRTAITANPTPAPATSQTMDSDHVDNPPSELAGNPQPVYPERERNRRREGDVTVKLLINERGHVEAVQLLDHNGSEKFVESVMQVIRQYRFTPGKHQGRVIKVWGIKTIRFEIGE